MVTLCLRLKTVKFYGEYQSCKEFYEDVSSVLICCFCCLKITSRLYSCSQDNVAGRLSRPVYIQIILLHENWTVGKIDQILIWQLTSWVILFLQSFQNRDMLCARLLFCSQKMLFLFSMICSKHNQFLSILDLGSLDSYLYMSYSRRQYDLNNNTLIFSWASGPSSHGLHGYFPFVYRD